MKKFKGKILYNPSGKAGEYSYWGANIVVGCSHGCTYCYCKKGILAGSMGMDKPQLKKYFEKYGSDIANQDEVFEVFKKEVCRNIESVKRYGIFFSFTTDPLLQEYWDLHWKCFMFCNFHEIPVKVLTKRADWVDSYLEFIKKSNSDNAAREWRKLIAFGFTLTGHDEMEQGASTNAERIDAGNKLHNAGFKLFYSVEPIVDIESSWRVIIEAYDPFISDRLFKIGLLSGVKYNRQELVEFIKDVNLVLKNAQIYWKDSVLKQAGIKREDLPKNCVTRKYNIFTGGDECLEECTSCNKKFDIEDMESDSEGNWFCKECYNELAPVMAADFNELKERGEIE